MTEPLEFDGERFTPENVREIWYEHMHRYVFASQWVAGRAVLDAACGEGYGSAILARSAESVTGVDLSDKAIAHARRRYGRDRLEFRVADCCDLPFEDASFDCIVSFETVEHLDDQAGMLAEFARVLRPAGFVVISSPDKAVYSDLQGFQNPHHVRELYDHEFRALLRSRFPACRFYGQKLLFHSAIWNLAESSGSSDAPPIRAQLQNFSAGAARNTARPVQAPMYLLAVCAPDAQSLPAAGPELSLFDDEEESVYQHYQHEIRKNMHAGAILAERDEALAQARQALDAERARAAVKPSWLSRLGLWRRDRS